MEKKIIISLGRQFGSGGRSLGKKLADKLGIAYYDRELMDEISKHSGMDLEYINQTDEHAPGFFDYALIGRFGTTRLFGSSQNFVLLSETIRKIAAEKSCLIVGRTADYILRNEPNLIKIFVHAPNTYRIKNVARRLNIKAEEAENIIVRNDKERARFYDFFTDKTWGEASSYDLSVDISKLGEDGTVNFLADYIRQRIERF
jgi:cytidylate kinase